MTRQEILKKLSSEITDEIKAADFWKNPQTILLYYPLKDEVDVLPLIKEGTDSGKTVLLPAVDGENLKLGLFKNSFSLKKGRFDIYEPKTDFFAPERYLEIDLAIIPGMAFDKKCNRLGRGKGYYDRFLPLLKNAFKVGVCFPFQMFEKIPCEECDVKTDIVVYKKNGD